MTQSRLVGSRYELGAMIGRGGMGDVYRGVDTYTGQIVAIKLLHQDIVADNPYLVDRFKREGEALRQLNHPNIVQILDTVEDGDRHYLIMEYVGGGSLRTQLDKHGPLPVEQILNIALDLADALARAHRMNIIHRDIKPDNVLLTDDGEPRLTDFGVAHLGDRTRLTQTGSVIGTYAYLSPEACNGLPLDERADIWSFGVMLYETLTGQPPFKAESTGAILTAILTKPAPDLSRLRPEVPYALVSLISHMLEKDRERRISSVRLVGAELEAMIRGFDTPMREMVAGPIGQPDQSSRFATPPSEQPTTAGQEPGVPAMEGGTRMLNTPPGYPGYGTPGRITPPYTPPGTPPYIPPGTPGATPYPPYQTPGAQWVNTPPEARLIPTAAHAPISGIPWRWITTIVAIVAVATTIIAVVAIIFIGGGGGDSDVITPTHPAAVATEFQPELVAQVDQGQTMVLVAKLEQLSGIEQLSGMRPRDVSRFIVDDLDQRLQTVAPFSAIRVRAYPQVITTEDQAHAVADANGAAVIIWGNYNTSVIELEIQIGALAGYPHNPFPRDTLEQTANVRVHMRDERQESAAPYVLGVLDVLNMADGGGFETMRTRAVMDTIGDVQPGNTPEDSVAAYTHRAFQVVLEDPAQAVQLIDSALALAPGNALLYVERGAANQRQSKLEDARRDLETAQRLGPAHWTMPQLLLTTMTDNLNRVFALFDEIIVERPDDWFPLFFRGAIYYQSGAYDIAQDNIDQAIALSPDANFPYIYGALLAMHEGRLNDAGAMIRTILEDYPDPEFMNRLIASFFGSNALSSYGYKLSAFGNMVLGRYEAVLDSTDSGLDYFSRDVDLYVIQGFAQCALGDYALAEQSYTNAIGLEPNFTLIYLLRAEVRRKQRSFTTAAADLQTANQSIQGQEFLPLAEAVRQGTIGCGNFFSMSNPLLDQAATAEPGG